MREFFRWAFGYALAALAGGVLYREVTKINSFTGQCSLGLVHGHLLALGMLGFLVIALLEYHLHITQARTYRPFMYCYNLGIIVTAGMLGVRGWVQIYDLPDNAAISGIAGAGHILLAAGIILLFCALFERSKILQETAPSQVTRDHGMTNEESDLYAASEEEPDSATLETPQSPYEGEDNQDFEPES